MIFINPFNLDDHQLYRELCGRSPPEILRVFGPIEVNFQSDKTVQRRGWTAAVNIYDCNYPHLENNHWRHKSKKISRKKTYHSSTIPSTLSTITTTTTTTTTETTTAETTAFIETSTETTETVPTTTVQQQTQFETSNPTESFTSESAQTEFHTVAQYFTNASTVEATYDFFTEEISTTQKPFENETTESADNETFDDLTDKIDVTLNRIEDWSKDLSNFTKELERLVFNAYVTLIRSVVFLGDYICHINSHAGGMAIARPYGFEIDLQLFPINSFLHPF